MATAGVDGLIVLDGGDALLFLRTAIDEARARIWVQQFVIDVRPKADRSGMMRHILHALARAAGRGVDVRVLVPAVMAPSGDPHDMNLPAVRFLAARGVAVRRYEGSTVRPHHHAKVTIIDDDLLTVSNSNWTTRAFRENTEQGVAIRSVSVAGSAAGRFDWLWSNRAAPPIAEYDPFIVRFLRDRRPSYWPARRAPLDPFHTYPGFERRGHHLYGTLVGHLRCGCSVRSLHGQRYARAVEAMIRSAKSRVLVAMSAMRASTDRQLRALPEALEAAADRGIDVRVLFQVRDWPRADLTADLSTLRNSRVRLRSWPMDSRMHLRSVIVDDGDVVVGSVGWTPQSIYLSEELSVHISDRRTAMAFSARFEDWWSVASRRAPWQQVTVRRPASTPSREAPPASPAVATSPWSACICPCDVCVPDDSRAAASLSRPCKPGAETRKASP